MRQVQNDEPIRSLWMEHGKAPGDGAAPIVADDDCLLLLEMVEHGPHVAGQFIHAIGVDSLGLIAQVVAALIDGHHLIVLRQGGDLVAQVYQKSGNPWMRTSSGPCPAVT